MAARFDLTMDSTSAARLATFWKVALGYEDKPPPAPFGTRMERLLSLHLSEEEMAGDGAWLHDPAGVGPSISILDVPERKVAKNRLHIDIRVATANDPEERWSQILAEAARLGAAGARVLHEDLGNHIVMADPEGNEFCVA